MSSIKILLADDHEIVRKGLKSLIESELGLEVIGEASTGKKVIELARQKHPDVIVMDISMPRLNGFEATRRIVNDCPEVKILILTVHDDKEYIFRSLEAGASGYLIKKTAPENLIEAIRAIHGGGAYLGTSITEAVVKKFREGRKPSESTVSLGKLTGREREILQLIAEGNSTKEISDMLYISTNTVSTHRKNLMEKLDLHNVAQLTKFAITKGLVETSHDKG
mgnify:CR=1 FL=1